MPAAFSRHKKEGYKHKPVFIKFNYFLSFSKIHKIFKGGNGLTVSAFVFYILIFSVFICINGCNTTKKQPHQFRNKINYIYEQETVTEQIIKEKLFYKNDSTLDLYNNIYTANIPGFRQLEKTNEDSKENKFTLRYLILKDSRNKEILDSSIVTFNGSDGGKTYFQYQFKNIALKEKEFILRIELYDYFRHQRYLRTRWINTSLSKGELQFLLTHLPDSQPYLNNYFTRKDSFLINNNQNIKGDKLFILYSALQHKAAAPPFVNLSEKTQTFRTDSITTLKIGPNIRFYLTGNYLIKTDTLQKEGLWLNCFMDGFPQLKQPHDFADPLIYITSRNEFMNIQNAADKKIEAYKFWYSLLGSTRRGGIAADAYYKRVSQANESFTSYKEGWKTDRGMIYIIFGKPDIIYKDKQGENWVYKENNFFPGTKFIFRRVSEAWGDDVTLIRDESLRNIWYIAVDAWRRGRLRL